MPSDNQLIGVVDVPGEERDALADTIARDGLAVLAVESVEQLPDETALVVAHSRAVSPETWPTCAGDCRRWWSAMNARMPSCSRRWMPVWWIMSSTLRHGHLLRRMIRRVIEINRLAEEREQDRRRLAELNEHLETHLAMLRLDQQAGGRSSASCYRHVRSARVASTATTGSRLPCISLGISWISSTTTSATRCSISLMSRGMAHRRPS